MLETFNMCAQSRMKTPDTYKKLADDYRSHLHNIYTSIKGSDEYLWLDRCTFETFLNFALEHSTGPPVPPEYYRHASSTARHQPLG